MKMRNTIGRRLWRARDGVTAIEFAVIAPVLLLLMFGIMEFAMIMLMTNVMESATAISSRTGKTGGNTDGLTRDQTILAAVQAKTYGLVDMNQLSISSKSYSQFDQINDPEPWTDDNHNGIAEVSEYEDINMNGIWDSDMGRPGYGGADDIVVYTISYPWPIATPMLREFLGDANGNYVITAHSVVKNEPYDD